MSGKVEFAFWSPQAGATVKTLLDRAEMAERLGYHRYGSWITSGRSGCPTSICSRQLR